MKKLFLVSAIVLSLGTFAPVFAAQTTADLSDAAKTGDVEVTYTMVSGYTVTIPADFDVTTSASEHAVSASNVMINDGETLNVKIKSKNAWNLVDTSAADNKIAYEVSLEGKKVADNTVVLAVPAGTATKQSTLSAIVPTAPLKAGIYKDTLTFTVSVDR